MSEISLNNFIDELLENLEKEMGDQEDLSFREEPLAEIQWQTYRQAFETLLKRENIVWEDVEIVDTESDEFRDICRKLMRSIEKLMNTSSRHSEKRNRLMGLRFTIARKIKDLTGMMLM